MQRENIIVKQGFTIAKFLLIIYPWLIWMLGASFFFYKYLVQVSPSVMTDDLMRAFHVHATGLGNLSACYFYSYLVMQIPVGLLLDKYSPRYLTAFAILICGVSTLIFAQTNSILLASIARAFIGLGAAFAAISIFKLSAVWFSAKRFALVSGMCMTAAMLGAIFGQLPLSWLVQKLEWRCTLNIIGDLGILLSLIYILIVRDKSIDHSNKQIKTFRDPADDEKLTRPININLFQIVKNKQAWLLSLYSGLAFAPISVFGGLWGVPFIKIAHHLTASQAAFATSFIFIGFAVGAPFLGWLSDYIKRRKPILLFGPSLALISLCIVIYCPDKHISTISILLFAFGFGVSGFFTSFAMIREVFPIAIVATVLGFMNTFDSICEAISEPLVGMFLDLSGLTNVVNRVPQFSLHGYQLALSVLPIYLLLAIITLFFIDETYCRLKE